MNKRKNNSSLMRNSIIILTGVCFAVVVTFLINNFIIHRWYREESVENRRSFFRQITEKIQEEENSIVNLTDSILSNNVVLDYLRADVLGERWDRLAGVKQFASGLMKLNGNIEAVCIRDENGEVIAMQGTKYAPLPEEDARNAGQRFTNRISVSGENIYYFYTGIPVYERTEMKNYVRAGDVSLLFNTSWLKETLRLAASAFSEENTYLAVWDRNGHVLTYVGNPQIYEEYIQEQQPSRYLYFQEELEGSGWSICSITRQASFMEYINQVQVVNLVTYAVVIAALVWMCFMMYHKVIKSIRRQLEFVANYTKDTSQRMEVWDKSEFGELEQELNEMLDKMEELNRNILKEKEERIHLEYAKKQTEMIAYKNQINPHFMFNTLECLRGMALYRGEKEIARLTEAMARMFQYNVKGEEIVTVKEMLQSIRDYAVIINYRFMGKITVQIEAEDEAYPYRIPKMIVQPFVENAVRHGLEPRVGKGSVQLKIACLGEKLRIVIEDDGVGMSQEQRAYQQQKLAPIKNPGWQSIPEREIGVANVARRINLFYGEDYRLEFSGQEGKGTTVTMELPKELPGGREESR